MPGLDQVPTSPHLSPWPIDLHPEARGERRWHRDIVRHGAGKTLGRCSLWLPTGGPEEKMFHLDYHLIHDFTIHAFTFKRSLFEYLPLFKCAVFAVHVWKLPCEAVLRFKSEIAAISAFVNPRHGLITSFFFFIVFKDHYLPYITQFKSGSSHCSLTSA